MGHVFKEFYPKTPSTTQMEGSITTTWRKRNLIVGPQSQGKIYIENIY